MSRLAVGKLTARSDGCPPKGPWKSIFDHPRGGSVIFYGGDGRIPGLTGRLKPMCEPGESAYLYADNITINRGKQQPVAFYFGEDLRLTDSYGSEALIRIADVAGKSSLIEHRPFHSE